MHPDVAAAHHGLVDRLIARGSLWSRPLVDAFRATPRHQFLDRVYYFHRRAGRWLAVRTRPLRRGALRLVYSDRALTTHMSPEAPGRPPVAISSSSQPSLMAQMLEDLRLRPGLRTLEVGAGTGYNAALLARASGPVVSLDVDPAVVAEARGHLRAFPDRPVELHSGDGRDGFVAGAPYDRILVTAASPDLEPAWLAQAADGGVVQAPLVLAPGLAYLVQGEVRGGRFEGRLTRPAYFIPLRPEGADGDEAASGGGSAALVPDPGSLTAVPAPWAGWARRPPAGPEFVRALAFLAWLGDLTVAHRAFGSEGAVFGVADLVRGNACWLGMAEWRVSGPAGRELGRRLWRLFLDLGGPWPTDFRLRACAAPRDPGPPGGAGADRLTARKQGPRTNQVWELIEPRERPAGP
jgi:protein-L-isoaspartate(D-aspartate) O-methyltransferase